MQAKRCGHRPGKEIVSKQEMVDRVKAAVDARTDRSFVIMARTDALAVEGIEQAIERAVACVEAGADMIFPEAMTELAMYRRFKDAVKVPILANITEFGQTPLFTRDELGAVGVDIVLYCCSAYRAMNAAALAVYEAIRRDGTQKNVLDRMQTRADLYQYLDYHCVRGEVGRIVCRGEREMSEQQAAGFKPKKSVALSGVAAGNTALCTVGTTGNDLHYRGYDILDIATDLRVRGDRLSAGAREAAESRASSPPTRPSSRACAACRGGVLTALEQLPAAEPPDGRAAHGRVGARLPRAGERRPSGRGCARHRRPAARVPRLDAVLLVSLRDQRPAHRGARPTTIRSARISCICCTASEPPAHWVRAMHTSLILYAEHEFNASTFTARVIAGTGSDMYSCITGAIGALRGPKHGGANEVAFEIQSRYAIAG